MTRSFTLFACVALMAMGLVAGPLPAVGDLDVDFRLAAWSGGLNQFSFTSSVPTIGDVTVIAQPDGSKLWHDTIDGFGVRGGEDDEIDGRERLKVTFVNPIIITAFAITDLFKAPDGGGEPKGEHGVAEFYNGANLVATIDFFGIDSHQTNGEQLVSVNDLVATKVIFKVGNTLSNNEFSVAGFNIGGDTVTEPVPEPGTLTLFGLGAGLVALAARKRALRSQA